MKDTLPHILHSTGAWQQLVPESGHASEEGANTILRAAAYIDEAVLIQDMAGHFSISTLTLHHAIVTEPAAAPEDLSYVLLLYARSLISVIS